jgi:hypothetical protein
VNESTNWEVTVLFWDQKKGAERVDNNNKGLTTTTKTLGGLTATTTLLLLLHLLGLSFC